MYVYGVCLFYVCCSDCMGFCGNVCVGDVVEDSGFLALECCTMLYVCVMDVMFSVCIVKRGAVGSRVWEV